VQHLDGSIIKELRVKEGDRLATGDVLVVLDDTQTRAEHHMPWQQFLVPHGTAERFRVELAQQPHLDETEGLKALAHIRGKVTPPADVEGRLPNHQI
jgi:membrane fusion protein, epimerase transport system